MELESRQECVVCYEPTADFVRPCKHPLCGSCAYLWFSKRTVCPYCLTVPSGFCANRPDRGERDVYVKTTPLGLTLTNMMNQVVVKAVVRRDSAYRSGLREGDVITYVNGLPVSCHRDAIAVIRSAETAKEGIVLTTIPMKTRHWKFCPCM